MWAQRPQAHSCTFIFSKTNYDNFQERLSTTDWTCIYKEADLNNAYDKFHSVVTTAFNESFPSKKLSKKG